MGSQNLLTGLCVLLVFIGSASAEEYTSAQGMAKIKNNVTVSKKNKDEYDKNLQVVKDNLSEIKRTKDQTLAQKKGVTSELTKSADALKKISQQEKELQALQETEKEKLKIEEKQVQQLQAQIDQIKKNQEQRQAIIGEYQNQLSLISGRKTEWKERETKLKAQDNQLDESVRKLASDESTWNGKKQTYEKELKRWSAESSRTQRIHDTYQGIAEGK